MPSQTTHYDDARVALSRWRKRILGALWITYAAFYLCRVNLAAAQGQLARDRGVSKNQLGLMLALLKSFYATGQLVNGVLADHLRPRRMIAIGLTGSALLNLAFSHLDSYRWMAVVWALNGYLQALGWTPIVRILANWFPPRLRDVSSGAIGTAYILGSGLSWLLSGYATSEHGWRYAFWIPAWVCLAVVGLFLLVVREGPGDLGLPEENGEKATAEGAQEQQVPLVTVLRSLASPWLWMVALGSTCLCFGWHGLLDWTPHFLAEVGGCSAEEAARKAFLLPLGGAIGCSLLTYLARRTRRSLPWWVVPTPLLVLAVLTYNFPALMERVPGLLPLGLMALGMFSAGPAALIACAMPTNIAGSASAGTAAGLVDAMGYVGSATSGWVSGHIMDRVGQVRGSAVAWRTVWHLWPVGMVAAAILTGIAGRHNQLCAVEPSESAPPMTSE
jgi:sugar phosphate permease